MVKRVLGRKIVDTPQWLTISDDLVRHVWLDREGKKHYIACSFYADAGTPIDEFSGEDMTYSHTEVWR